MTSTYEYDQDLHIYFISKLSGFSFENAKHSYEKDKRISEFLVNKYTLQTETTPNRFNCDLIALKVPNLVTEFKHIKGITQQAICIPFLV